MGRKWSKEDIAILNDCYTHIPAKQLADTLGRSFSAIIHKANRLGLGMKRKRRNVANRGVYDVWKQIINRTTKHNHPMYKYYKDISLSEEWEDYATFERDLLEMGYCKGMNLHRINPKGDYERGNVVVLTKSEHSLLHTGKLSHEQVFEVLILHLIQGVPRIEIAEEMGVQRACIDAIVTGRQRKYCYEFFMRNEELFSECI